MVKTDDMASLCRLCNGSFKVFFFFPKKKKQCKKSAEEFKHNIELMGQVLFIYLLFI